jgi:uncharacterized protein YfaS (alpha-2-macroglobulin family)
MMRREGATWSSSTRTNTLVALALSDWMILRHDAGGPAIVHASLNGSPLKDVSRPSGRPAAVGKGAVPQEATLEVPAADLKAGANRLVLSNEGGNAFYTVESRTWPETMKALPSSDRGLAMHREYYKRIFNYDQKGNLTYRYEPIQGPVKVGDEILVMLKMASWSSARYLSIEDPVPAGFEVYDREPTDLYPRGYQRDYISRTFYRDQKVVFYQDHAEPRVYVYLYMMRATTPGTYAINPGHIRLVYYPSVEGHTESNAIEVAP